MTDQDFTEDEVIALRKCDAAARQTTSPGYALPDTYNRLAARGLIIWTPGWHPSGERFPIRGSKRSPS